MTHESLGSYYENNFQLLFHKDIGFVNNFRLGDIEDMLPYEREIYMAFVMDKIEKHKSNK